MYPAWCLALALCPPAQIIQVSHLALDYYQFDGAPRLAQAPQFTFTRGVAISLEVTAARILYWRNRVHGEIDLSQFRLVGWEFELGIRMGRVEIYRSHHSQHILDAEHPWMRFPVQDTLGIRVYLLGESK